MQNPKYIVLLLFVLGKATKRERRHSLTSLQKIGQFRNRTPGQTIINIKKRLGAATDNTLRHLKLVI